LGGGAVWGSLFPGEGHAKPPGVWGRLGQSPEPERLLGGGGETMGEETETVPVTGWTSVAGRIAQSREREIPKFHKMQITPGLEKTKGQGLPGGAQTG